MESTSTLVADPTAPGIEAPGPTEPAPILSEAEHEQGFKDLPVLFRSGRRDTLRLTAPSFRVAERLTRDWAKRPTENAWDEIVIECLPGDRGIDFLDKLTPGSASEVQVVSFALTFGEDALKKMIALGKDMERRKAGQNPSAAEPSSASASALASPGPSSSDGACPN